MAQVKPPEGAGAARVEFALCPPRQPHPLAAPQHVIRVYLLACQHHVVHNWRLTYPRFIYIYINTNIFGHKLYTCARSDSLHSRHEIMHSLAQRKKGAIYFQNLLPIRDK